MLKDLENFSGYRCYIEKRRVKCLVLKRAADFEVKQANNDALTFDSTEYEGYSRMRKYETNFFAYWIENSLEMANINIPVVDETECTKEVFAVVPFGSIAGGLSLERMGYYLRKYGFRLEEGYRDLDMLVLEKK
jgi:hypothetical protein